MTSHPLATPVVLCVYNRPHLTQQILDALRAVRPLRILVIADGPRTNDPTDHAKCEDVIRIIRSIDWEADIDWNVSDVNLGCRKRIQTGLSWAFARVEEAIVLEDDCVPHPSFFRFCRELLDRYRSNRRVVLISGSSFVIEQDCAAESYLFSRYPLIWGWAAWRRSWELYDPDVDSWERLRDTPWLSNFLADPLAAAYWRRIFEHARSGYDTWDYSMTFSCWHSGGLSVHPRRNLISNIGFGSDATHTRDLGSVFANLPVQEMAFPLVHPKRVERAVAYDERTERTVYSKTAEQQLQYAREVLRTRAGRVTWRPDASAR
jgi:hypothetical protein